MKFRSFKIIAFWLVIISAYLRADNDTPKRIMPLGDSITLGFMSPNEQGSLNTKLMSGYRNYLWYKLQDANYTVDFVGSIQAGQDVLPQFDPDNEGHIGWTSYEIAELTYDSMVANQANIVLLHAGTNDQPTTNPQGIVDILDEIDSYEKNFNTHVKVFVALIIGDLIHGDGIAQFNERLKKLLDKRISKGDDIVIVDMFHNAGLTESDFADKIHPNNTGYHKMANVWFNALMQHKEDNGNLRKFPSSLVPSSHIILVTYDDEHNIVTFTAKIPDEGILF